MTEPTNQALRSPTMSPRQLDCLPPRSRAPFAILAHWRFSFGVLAFLVFPPASSGVQATPV
jgi:hypothetical protein